MSRFHLCTFLDGSCVSVKAMASEYEAYWRYRERIDWQQRENLYFLEAYIEAHRTMKPKTKNCRPVSPPYQLTHRYTVEPCTCGERCPACLMAGLI